MNKRKSVIIGSVFGVLIIAAFLVTPMITGNFLFFGSGKPDASTQTKGEVRQVVLTKDNFYLFLKQQPIVSALPDDAIILFRMYNFDKGYRVWDKSYVITKGSVKEGSVEKPDFDIIISSRYMGLIAQDLCGAVKKAKENGDFAVDTSLSTTSIMWKYKSMMSYRACFGY